MRCYPSPVDRDVESVGQNPCEVDELPGPGVGTGEKNMP
jgi:hypothetical protein